MSFQKSYQAILGLILTCALIVGFSDTARAQTVSVDHPTVTFTNIPSGSVSSQQVNVSTTSSTTVFINPGGTPSWLTVTPTGYRNLIEGTPLVLTVTATTTNLPQTSYVGTFTIVSQQTLAVLATVTVNLSVGGTSALTSNPASLGFTSTIGTLEQNIATQNVTISSSSNPLNFTVSASTNDGASWLVPFVTSGNTSSSPTVTIGVNPAGLTSNTYTGTIVVQSSTTADAVAIPVTLTLASATSLTVTPSTLQPFLFQIGGSTPPSQSLMVSSTNSATVPFTVSMSPQVSWLVFNLNGSTGTSGSAVAEAFSVNPVGMAAGSYTTQVTFTNTTTGVALAPITAQLVVSANPLLSVSNNALSYTAQFGSGNTPSGQTVNITTVGSSSTSVGFTYSSDSAWLSAIASGSATPATLTVNVNPNGLSAGTYSGNITVRPSNGDNYALKIAVTLTVNNLSQVTAGPGALLFSFQLNQSVPAAQLVQISSVGQPVSFTATASSTTTANCPSGWLQVNTSSNTTPATLSANVVTTGLTAGSCSGTISIGYGNSSTLSIPVTLNVSSTALLSISMPLGFGVENIAQGVASFQRYINLNSTDPTSPVLVSVSAAGGTWLFANSAGSQTPQQLTVLIQPGTMTPGTYSGTITISAPTSNLPSGPFSVPVTLTINQSITVTPTGLGANNSLAFTETAGGPLPSAQILTLTGSAAGASYTTSIPSSSVCSWLTLSSLTGSISTAGTALSVGVQTPSGGALAAGTYPCQFTLNYLNAASASLTVTATLTVSSSETFTVSPQALTFAYQVGGAAPASQAISVSGTPNSVNFTVGTTSNGGWLSTDAGSGAIGTPKTINVSIDPTKIPAVSLAGGKSVTGSITISAPSISSTPTVVNVTVNIGAAPTPVPVTIFNSANINGFGPIAPGELITIKGTNLGPATPAVFTVGSNNTVSSTLAGVQVLFDSTAGTPTYVSATQINVIVPWEVAGRAQTNITVSYNGGTSAGFTYNVVSATPAFYTLNSTGAGQAAALNQDYSINGPAAGVTISGTTIATKPATAGSEVAIYGTGAGVTNPGGTDGTVTPGTQLFPLLNAGSVTATIGGQPAVVYFVGAAPDEVTGVFQVNLQVPAGVKGDALPVAILVNGVATITGPTISVQ